MLDIRLFGRPRFSVGGAAWDFAASRKTIPLLAYLLTRHEAPIAREYLAALLWPDDAEDAARTNLRRHLHNLAKALPPSADMPYILNTQHTTRWNPQAPARADVVEFTAASAVPQQLDRAADLYTGAFLEEFYDEWIVAERERLLGLQLDNLRKLVRRKRGERDLEGALADVYRILALDPWREDAIRMELTLRDELGDRSGALAAYRAFAERLRADLDTEPMPETLAAYESLLRDDGTHRAALTPLSVAPQRDNVRSLPFFGRDDALAVLRRTWMSAASGHGSVTLVGGEAGIGKSRLVAESSLRAEAQGARVFAGATPPLESVPHEAVADCLRAAATLLEKSSLAPETMAMLGRLVPSFATPSLQAAAPATPEADRFALFEAVADAFTALARSRPLLIVLEDIHWAGSATFALLEFLALRLADRPIAFVATYRAEDVDRAHPLRAFRRKLERGPSFTHVALQRLDRATIHAIARELRSGTGDDFERDVDALFADSEGVPLFLEAALRDGSEAQTGYDRLRLDARVAALDPEALAVLEIASIVGAGFDVEVVREVLGWSEADVLVAIDRLISAYLVREPHRLRRNDFTFTHHLVREAVYATIDARTRVRRHAALAVVLSELHANAFEDVAATVARHWESAGRNDEAARAYAVAAKRSAGLYANDEARTFAAKSIALASDDALRCDMLLLSQQAADRLGDRDAQDADLAALETIAEGTGYLADYLLARLRLSCARAQYDDADRLLQRANAALAPGDERRRGAVRAFEAQLLAERGAFAEARTAMEEALTTAERNGDEDQTLRALQNIVTMSLDSLDISTVIVFAERMLQQAERTRDVERQAFAHDKLGVVRSREGKISESLEHFEAARAGYARIGDTLHAALVDYNIATVQVMLGRFAEARSVFAKAVERLQELQTPNSLSIAYSNLAAMELLMGDVTIALDTAERGIATCGANRSGIYAQLQVVAATSLRYLSRSNGARARLELALEAIRPYGESEPLSEALLSRMIIEIDANELDAARNTRTELTRLNPEIRRHSFSPETYPWFLAALASAEGNEAEAAALRHEAAECFNRRLEILAPDGRITYSAVPWIVPIAEYAASTTSRT